LYSRRLYKQIDTLLEHQFTVYLSSAGDK
jgi:hypothetical protein